MGSEMCIRDRAKLPCAFVQLVLLHKEIEEVSVLSKTSHIRFRLPFRNDPSSSMVDVYSIFCTALFYGVACVLCFGFFPGKSHHVTETRPCSFFFEFLAHFLCPVFMRFLTFPCRFFADRLVVGLRTRSVKHERGTEQDDI